MYICTVRFLKFSHIFKKLQTCVRQQTLNSDQVLQLVKLMIFMSFLPFFLLTSLFYRPHQIQYLTIASSGTVWLLEIYQFKRIQFLAARIAKRSRNLNLLYVMKSVQAIWVLPFYVFYILHSILYMIYILHICKSIYIYNIYIYIYIYIYMHL